MDCGVACVVSKKNHNIADLAVIMGVKLQHRGELSAGISLWNPQRPEKLWVEKDRGLVREVFKDNILRNLYGTRALFHVRYATSGPASDTSEFDVNLDDYIERILDEAQPFYRKHGNRHKRFSLVWNGTITNTEELREQLIRERDYDIETSTDTEILMHTIATSAAEEAAGWKKPDIRNIFAKVCGKIKGGYSVLYMNGDGNIAAIRDPHGLRPLCYGENEEIFAIASETFALQGVGITDFKFVNPGELLVYTDHIEKEQLMKSKRTAHCVFEWNYFSHPGSIAECGPVYDFRRRLGKALALNEPLKGRKDIKVVPAPDTAKPAALAFAEALGLEYVEAITKDIFGRGFTEPGRSREWKMALKYGYLPSVLKGASIFFIEDSFVKGGTSKRNVKLLYDAGVKEVHFRSTFPPVKHACYYGLDFPKEEGLLANKFSYKTISELEEKIAQTLISHVKAVNGIGVGKDIDFKITVKYNNPSDFITATGLPPETLCLACLNGDYPC